MRFLKLMHFTLCLVLFAAGWIRFRYHGNINYDDIGFRYNYYIVVVYGVILFFFMRTYNAYMFGYNRIRSLLLSQILSQLLSVTVVYVTVSVAWNRFDPPLVFAEVLAVQIVLDVIWSYAASKTYLKINPQKKTILIYRDERDKRRFGSLGGKPTERLYKIRRELEYDGDFEGISHILEGYEAIFVAGVNSRCRNGILKYCVETGIPGFFLPHVGDILMQDARHVQAFDAPLLYVSKKYVSPEYAVIKRLFDIAVSACGIIILSPVFCLTAVAIKLCDGGPVFYRQRRLTKDGKEFTIWKFRSMRVDAEKDGVARLSSGEDDDRITAVGRVIRTCRIDELPQLWNVLTGSMSLVGPRPERPEIAEEYCAVMPDFRLRLQIRAGITGYAQVYGKYNTDPYEKLEFDLMYINEMSILTDIRLMFATLRILFSPERTEGIDSEQITAMDYGSTAGRHNDDDIQ